MRKPKRPPPSPAEIEQAVRWYTVDGMFTPAIAERLNTTPGTVVKWLRAAGVTVVKQGRYKGRFKENMTNARRGSLYVVGNPRRVPRGVGTGRVEIKWECRCDCGRTVYMTTNQLRPGHRLSAQSCHPCARKKCIEQLNADRRLMTPEETAAAVEMYQAKQSGQKIGDKFGLHAGTVLRHLRSAGVAAYPIGHLITKYHFDHHAFDVPSAERNYWLGWTMADGCVYTSNRRATDTPKLSFGVGVVDKGHLEKFAAFLKSDMPIRLGSYRGGMNIGVRARAHICFPSHHLVATLKSLGVEERKSGREKVPPGFENDRDMWRGWVDGDGWLVAPKGSGGGYGGFVIGLCGSQTVCESFARYGAGVVGGSPPRVTATGSIWKTVFCSERGAWLMRHLYQDACIALDRKLAKALGLIARYEHIRQARQGACASAGCERATVFVRSGLCRQCHMRTVRSRSRPATTG